MNQLDAVTSALSQASSEMASWRNALASCAAATKYMYSFEDLNGGGPVAAALHDVDLGTCIEGTDGSPVQKPMHRMLLITALTSAPAGRVDQARETVRETHGRALIA